MFLHSVPMKFVHHVPQFWGVPTLALICSLCMMLPSCVEAKTTVIHVAAMPDTGTDAIPAISVGHRTGLSNQWAYDNLAFEPRPETERTVASAADLLQFSGCRGQIMVTNSRFSSAQGDAINVHETHLAVQELLSPKQVLVCFMHPQTYGFEAFFAGDDIEFIDDTLLTKARGRS